MSTQAWISISSMVAGQSGVRTLSVLENVMEVFSTERGSVITPSKSCIQKGWFSLVLL